MCDKSLCIDKSKFAIEFAKLLIDSINVGSHTNLNWFYICIVINKLVDYEDLVQQSIINALNTNNIKYKWNRVAKMFELYELDVKIGIRSPIRTNGLRGITWQHMFFINCHDTTFMKEGGEYELCVRPTVKARPLSSFYHIKIVD